MSLCERHRSLNVDVLVQLEVEVERGEEGEAG